MEWLDVTLVGIDRAAVALLEPELTAGERLGVLARWFPISSSTPRALLADLAEDRDDRWRRPWFVACALLAALDLPALDFEQLARAATHESPADDVDDDAQIVRETIAGIALRQTVGST